jgi:hypothetical protein
MSFSDAILRSPRRSGPQDLTANLTFEHVDGRDEVAAMTAPFN